MEILLVELKLPPLTDKYLIEYYFKSNSVVSLDQGPYLFLTQLTSRRKTQREGKDNP
jgi:hypothetical protein